MVSMKHFVDRHKDKRIWVCGTGPSLLFVDVDRLTEEDVIIACNSAVQHFPSAEYLLVVDRLVEEKEYWLYQQAKEVIILNPEIKVKPAKAHEIFHQSSEWGDWGIYKDRHFPGNSTHRAVSFAYCMGARKIIIAGCDCTGDHPYDPEEDKVEQPFPEDIMLWNEMYMHNPSLPIVTISPYRITMIPTITFEEALTC